MSVRNFGNVPLYSTGAASFTDPSTATLVAELILSTAVFTQTDNYEVRFCIGASTAASWRLEHALSSGLGSTGIVKQITVFTGTNQSPEYLFTFRANPGDRFRALLHSSFTGTAAGVIQAEAYT